MVGKNGLFGAVLLLLCNEESLSKTPSRFSMSDLAQDAERPVLRDHQTSGLLKRPYGCAYVIQ